MRCYRCGMRMTEEHKSGLFGGESTIHHCPRCRNEVREKDNGSLFTSLFHRDHGVETDNRKAGPIHLH